MYRTRKLTHELLRIISTNCIVHIDPSTTATRTDHLLQTSFTQQVPRSIDNALLLGTPLCAWCSSQYGICSVYLISLENRESLGIIRVPRECTEVRQQTVRFRTNIFAFRIILRICKTAEIDTSQTVLL